MHHSTTLFSLLLCLLSWPVSRANAQDAAATSQDSTGFQSLFNGRDLTGWEGDDRFWRVEDGAIVGQTTTDNPTAKNTFLVYSDREFGDFELRFSYRVEGGNSGVQYRSQLISNWVVKGLQADFEDQIHDGKDTYSGMFFEENGRMFMGDRGEMVIVRNNPDNPRKPQIETVASVGDTETLGEAINHDGWNDYLVIARGNVFIHAINGRVMSIGIDEDKENYSAGGILAWQLHSGPPLKIQMKDIRIRPMD